MSRTLKWILFPIAALATLVAMAYLIGLTRSPEILISVSIEINRPPEAVYKIVADPREMPKYWPQISRVEILSQSPLRYKVIAPEGTSTMEVVTDEPPRHLVVKSIEQSMGVEGIWDSTLTPTPTGTRIDHKSVMQFHNPLLRTLALFMDANAEEQQILSGIKRYAESR